MVESYLHKMAKELLYKEIEEKSGFEYKLSNGTTGFESLITREDYRGECVLMEFPTHEGYYPDEFGCKKGFLTEYSDKNCKKCIFNTETHCLEMFKIPCDMYTPKPSCLRGAINPAKNNNRYRLDNGKGYCKCSGCEHFNYNGSVVHDIAVFWKGNVRWVIEIINKHEPDWIELYASMPYPIYFVRAEDALKRVESTPTFVYKVVWTSDPK